MHTTRLQPSHAATTDAASADAAPCCPACGSAARRGPAAQYRCPACGSIWLPSRRGYTYDEGYPAARGHYDPGIARCKQLTLRHWLRRLAIPVAGSHVLEVGFGGGATLRWLHEQGAIVHGQEPVASNRAAAIAAGIHPSRIATDLAGLPGARVDLALYLDSFEHLLDPVAHLASLDALTRPGSRAVLVLPVADSRSRRMLGRLWPHDIADHWVFYSTQGLTRLWQRFGWQPVAQFYPWKYVSLATAAQHLQIKTGIGLPLGPLKRHGLWLNFGERGVVLEKRAVAA